MQRSERSHAVPAKLRWLLVGLIALSTALFLTGVAIEKNGRQEATTTNTQQQGTPTAASSGDPDGGHEGSSTSPSAEPSQAALSGETILGVDIEAPWFLALFLIMWLVLGAALFRFGRLALLTLLLVAVASLILDGGEVVHQTKEANTTIVIFAVLVAATHLVLAVLAGLPLVPMRRQLATEAR
jgi:hypothetical protein